MTIEREIDLPYTLGHSLKLNNNTQFVDRIVPNNRDQFYWLAPTKVRTRLTINENGLNGLSTTFLTNVAVNKFNPDFFKQILAYSNTINENVGLPNDAHDIIFRSSQTNEKDKNTKTRSLGVSEPALLVIDANTETPKYKVLDKTQHYFVDSPEPFFAMLKPGYFLLAHDDNEHAQKQAMHARILKNEETDNLEIVIATDTLHARDLGEGDAKYPYIRLLPEYFEDIGEIDNLSVLSYLNGDTGNTDLLGSRLQIQMRNCTRRNASYLLTKLKREQLMIRKVLEKTQKLFGDKGVIELRSYNLLEGGIGQKMHVLDYNNKFS